jgi:hypothetical protein
MTSFLTRLLLGLATVASCPALVVAQAKPRPAPREQYVNRLIKRLKSEDSLDRMFAALDLGSWGPNPAPPSPPSPRP